MRITVDSADGNPYLSAPDEDTICYACSEIFEHTPTVIQSGSPAGQLLQLDDDQMVEVCDDCMDRIADATIGDIYAFLEARGVDVEESPAVSQMDEQAE